ncbi:hypothetical protein ACTXP3_27440, partial [Klebsiella pneumoniae]|uniref:hypothetical protein n=1 Tax=Klebsiella pneumoniae TaxID=573 RepID=UPI003FD5D910
QYARLQELNTLAQDQAIVELSASEQEQLLIKEQMSNNKGAIDARTAANTVARSKEASEGSISEAQKQYEWVVSTAIYQRDV